LQKTKFISDKIAYYIDELLKFSRDIPLSQIPDYIKQRTNEKNILEKEIERLQEKIKLCETSLENEKMTSSEIKWYSDLKTGLKKYRIPTEDLSLFAKAVHGITQYGYMLIK
jgi:hypothetical protein